MNGCTEVNKLNLKYYTTGKAERPYSCSNPVQEHFEEATTTSVTQKH